MSSTVSSLNDLCVEYRDAVSAAVATTAAGPIGLAYVCVSLPALDCCPMIAVYAGGPGEGDTAPLLPPLSPATRTIRQGDVNLIQMTALVVRCIGTLMSDGQPPSPAQQEAAAKMCNDDVWAVWNWLKSRIRDKTLFTTPSGVREVFFDAAIPFNAQGGCAGFMIPIRVELGGYDA